MALEMRKKSLVYRWFDLYLRLGGTEKWDSDGELYRKILVEAPLLWLISSKMDDNFRISVFSFILGVIYA